MVAALPSSCGGTSTVRRGDAAAGARQCKRGHQPRSEPYACRVAGCGNELAAGYNQVRTGVPTRGDGR